MSDIPVSSHKIADPRLQSVFEINNVPALLPMSYRLWKPNLIRRLAIFLHGYADHSGSFLRRLFPNGWPEKLNDVGLLAPNGPFPVPVRTEEGWREAYSWYFFDEARKRMLISPDHAVTGIKMLLEKHELIETPKTIIGFSQGGFFSPYLARHLSEIESIVAIGSGYRQDYYEKLNVDQIRLIAIHGQQDEIFPVESAKQSHQKILELGFKGYFLEVQGARHNACSEFGQIITNLLETKDNG
jgi:predicted esterase